MAEAEATNAAVAAVIEDLTILELTLDLQPRCGCGRLRVERENSSATWARTACNIYTHEQAIIMPLISNVSIGNGSIK
jgi:hypothetical protein